MPVIKPTAVKELTGALEKNPQRRRLGEPVAEGEAVKPKYLKGRAAKLWEEFAPMCTALGTLKAVDAPEFATWCCLEAEFQADPDKMQSARIAQKRAYATQFGMSAGARAKMAVGAAEQSADPADKYFVTRGPGNELRQ